MPDKDSRMRASRELLDRLRKQKQTNDSYEDVINRLLDQQEQLQELVQEMNADLETIRQNKNSFSQPARNALERYADELQAVIEGEQ